MRESAGSLSVWVCVNGQFCWLNSAEGEARAIILNAQAEAEAISRVAQAVTRVRR